MTIEEFQSDIVLAWDTENMKDFLKDIGDCELHATYKDGRLFFEVEDLEREMTTVDGSSLTIARRPKLDGIIKAKFDIEIVKLKRAIKSATKLSDHAVFKCIDGKFHIIAQKETGDKVTLKAPIDVAFEQCKSNFDLDYLDRIVNQLRGNKDKKVTVEMGDNCPVIFHDFISEKSSAHFFLAPRVESD